MVSVRSRCGIAEPFRLTGEVIASDEIDRAVLGLIVHVVAWVGCWVDKAVSHLSTSKPTGVLLHIAPEQLAMRTGRFVMVTRGQGIKVVRRIESLFAVTILDTGRSRAVCILYLSLHSMSRASGS